MATGMEVAVLLLPLPKGKQQVLFPFIPRHEHSSSSIISLFGSIGISHGDSEQPEDSSNPGKECHTNAAYRCENMYQHEKAWAELESVGVVDRIRTQQL